MAQQSFSDILGELQADFLDVIEAGRRHAASLERLRAMTSPVIAPMPAPRAVFERSEYAVLAREWGAAFYGGAAEPGPVAGLSLAQLRWELALKPGAKRLNELRRRFAKERHPDRVTPAKRTEATIEMQVANDLIDQALRELV